MVHLYRRGWGGGGVVPSWALFLHSVVPGSFSRVTALLLAVIGFRAVLFILYKIRNGIC